MVKALFTTETVVVESSVLVTVISESLYPSSGVTLRVTISPAAAVLRKYRAIKVVSWRVNFSTDAIADFEGLLAVNREICKQQMSEKAPQDVPPYCAVFP